MKELIIDTCLGEVRLRYCFDIDSNREFYEVYHIKSDTFLGEIPNSYSIEEEENIEKIRDLIETNIFPF